MPEVSIELGVATANKKVRVPESRFIHIAELTGKVKIEIGDWEAIAEQGQVVSLPGAKVDGPVKSIGEAIGGIFTEFKITNLSGVAQTGLFYITQLHVENFNPVPSGLSGGETGAVKNGALHSGNSFLAPQAGNVAYHMLRNDSDRDLLITELGITQQPAVAMPIEYQGQLNFYSGVIADLPSPGAVANRDSAENPVADVTVSAGGVAPGGAVNPLPISGVVDMELERYTDEYATPILLRAGAALVYFLAMSAPSTSYVGFEFEVL